MDFISLVCVCVRVCVLCMLCMDTETQRATAAVAAGKMYCVVRIPYMELRCTM